MLNLILLIFHKMCFCLKLFEPEIICALVVQDLRYYGGREVLVGCGRARDIEKHWGGLLLSTFCVLWHDVCRYAYTGLCKGNICPLFLMSPFQCLLKLVQISAFRRILISLVCFLFIWFCWHPNYFIV